MSMGDVQEEKSLGGLSGGTNDGKRRYLVRHWVTRSAVGVGTRYLVYFVRRIAPR